MWMREQQQDIVVVLDEDFVKANYIHQNFFERDNDISTQNDLLCHKFDT